MNNCIFTTHSTLTKEHAEYSLRSLLSNQTTSIVWDWFIIYNTHSHTIDNDWLQDKIKELDKDFIFEKDTELGFIYEFHKEVINILRDYFEK